MIRPFTILTLLLALGSGLYLYQSKHRVAVMDREIERVAHATEAARERSGLLRAEYTLLNDPERLAALADKHLELRPTQPGQMVALADLAQRLPPVRPAPDPGEATPDAPDPLPAVDAPVYGPPVPPKLMAKTEPPKAAKPPTPAPPPDAVAAATKPPVRVITASVLAPVTRPVAPSPSVPAAAPPRPQPPVQTLAAVPVRAAYAPPPAYAQVGSALGMARLAPDAGR